MRFIHSLVKVKDGERIGWCAPVELGESTPHSISFAIPIDDRMDERYTCEIVRMGGDGKIVVAHEMVKEGKDSFLLVVGDVKLWFTVRPWSKDGRRLPYIGRLKHADFTSRFIEIEPEEPWRLDQLCESEDLIVVGCDPFSRYSGVEAVESRRDR
jgi:hypothetical protein